MKKITAEMVEETAAEMENDDICNYLELLADTAANGAIEAINKLSVNRDYGFQSKIRESMKKQFANYMNGLLSNFLEDGAEFVIAEEAIYEKEAKKMIKYNAESQNRRDVAMIHAKNIMSSIIEK